MTAHKHQISPFTNSLKILECATNRDSLLLATLRYVNKLNSLSSNGFVVNTQLINYPDTNQGNYPDTNLTLGRGGGAGGHGRGGRGNRARGHRGAPGLPYM